MSGSKNILLLAQQIQSDREIGLETGMEMVTGSGSAGQEAFLIQPRRVDSPTSSLNKELCDPLNLKKFKVDLGLLKSSELRAFYKEQNDLIDSFLANPEDEDDRNEIDVPEYKIAMYGSFSANVVLFSLQLTAAILSKSLALLATTLDAFMDLASGIVLLYTGRLAASHNYLAYPTGKGKYKTAGIIVFSTLMGTLALQIWV